MAAPTSAEDRTVTIFHTADLHSRLPPAAGRQLVRLRQDHPGCLLLDAGDAVAAGNLTFRLRGEPILRQMAAIGYDAMAITPASTPWLSLPAEGARQDDMAFGLSSCP